MKRKRTRTIIRFDLLGDSLPMTMGQLPIPTLCIVCRQLLTQGVIGNGFDVVIAGPEQLQRTLKITEYGAVKATFSPKAATPRHLVTFASCSLHAPHLGALYEYLEFFDGIVTAAIFKLAIDSIRDPTIGADLS